MVHNKRKVGTPRMNMNARFQGWGIGGNQRMVGTQKTSTNARFQGLG